MRQGRKPTDNTTRQQRREIAFMCPSTQLTHIVGLEVECFNDSPLYVASRQRSVCSSFPAYGQIPSCMASRPARYRSLDYKRAFASTRDPNIHLDVEALRSHWQDRRSSNFRASPWTVAI